MQSNSIPLFVTSPHSGESVPPEASWLNSLSEVELMSDADRYVDQLYREVCEKLELPFIDTNWHRYAADLNRKPSDVDRESVVGHENKAGAHPNGLHWVVTKSGLRIMPSPISLEQHQILVEKYHKPFHERVQNQYSEFKSKFSHVYQIDAHSMPSVGTELHNDPGEERAEIVVSDQKGRSCRPEFMELVTSAFRNVGFNVAQNWPYFGGGVTQQYGNPAQGQSCLQVELNRSLYMNEKTKQKLTSGFLDVKSKVEAAVSEVARGVLDL